MGFFLGGVVFLKLQAVSFFPGMASSDGRDIAAGRRLTFFRSEGPDVRRRECSELIFLTAKGSAMHQGGVFAICPRIAYTAIVLIGKLCSDWYNNSFHSIW